MLNQNEQKRVLKAISSRVYDLQPSQKTPSDLHRELHGDIKIRWGVTSYRNLSSVNMIRILNFINSWIPK